MSESEQPEGNGNEFLNRIQKVPGGYLLPDDIAQGVLKTIDQLTTGMPQIVKALEEQSKRLDQAIEFVQRFRMELLEQIPAEIREGMDLFTVELLKRLRPSEEPM